MKKFTVIITALVLALCMVAGQGLNISARAEEAIEYALITDIGTIDDKSFNQGAWEGLKAFTESIGADCIYYQPSDKSTEEYLNQIDLAVIGGAKYIVTPGYLFEEAIFIAQDMYPEVKFILLDGAPHNADYSEFRTNENVLSVFYKEEQSGYLAGYAAVKEGYTKFGFMGGMAVPAVIRFGYGFVQGVENAAKEIGLTDVQMNYHYTGGFTATPEAQTLAATWYNDGVEVIFACGGAVGNSVMAAAEASNGGKVIGVDVDQSGDSETVITSAVKALSVSVVSALEEDKAGKFPGGQTMNLGATENGVGLPMETSRFATFAQADYDAVYATLASGEVTLLNDTAGDTPTDLGTTIVKINVVE